MKCHLHNIEDAVGTCNDCGLGICSTCHTLFEPQLCLRCGDSLNRKEKTKAILTLISPFILIPLIGSLIWFAAGGLSSNIPVYKIFKFGFTVLIVGHGMYFLYSDKKSQTFGEEIGNAIIALPVLFISFILSLNRTYFPRQLFKS